MRNLIKTETKAALDEDAVETIEEKMQILGANTKSAAYMGLYTIINKCINAAYKLGKIDAKKEMSI